MTDRRTALHLGLGGAAMLLADCGRATPLADVLPTQQIGVVPGNDLRLVAQWRRWLGRAEDQDLLYFNQQDWPAFDASVPFITSLGKAVIVQGARVQWSVPVGGPHVYADAASGAYDALYRGMARAILAVTPASAGRIAVRLPWEFNMDTQTLAARDAAGRWDPPAYIAAYRRIAGLLRRESPRFYFDWCPNIGKGGIEPERCYPGDDVVDVISADVYYRGQYDDQGRGDAGKGIFYYRKSQPYGLDWLADFGKRHGKLIGLSEWGVDDDRATAFMQLMTEWIVGQGARLSHHNYWDRSDGGIDARLSDGHLPAVGAIYRRAFGPGSPLP